MFATFGCPLNCTTTTYYPCFFYIQQLFIRLCYVSVYIFSNFCFSFVSLAVIVLDKLVVICSHVVQSECQQNVMFHRNQENECIE